MKHLYELHRVSQIFFFPLNEDRSVISKGLTASLMLCKGDSLDPACVIDFYQEDFHHKYEDVWAYYVPLGDPLLELDIVSLVATQEDEGFPLVKEE